MGALIRLIGWAGRAYKNLAYSSALLFQSQAEAVIAFTQLRIDLESVLEGSYCPGEIATLSQGLAELVLDAGVVWFDFGNSSQM